MRVLVIGAHRHTPALLAALEDAPGVRVCALVTREGCPWADEVEPPVCPTDSINEEWCTAFIHGMTPDIAVCLGWYEVIDESVYDMPTHGTIGVHAAPLPEGRGQAPVNWQLIHGREEATVSVYQFTDEVDAGRLFGQRTIPILEREAVSSLTDRLVYHGIQLVCEVVTAERPTIGEPISTPQDHARATYWPARHPMDSLLDWGFPAVHLDRFVRALADPYPNAYTYFEGRRLTISRAVADLDLRGDGPPGTVIGGSREHLAVQTGEGALVIERVGVGGQPHLAGGELADAVGLTPGDRIGTGGDYPSGFTYSALRGPGGRFDLACETNVAVGDREGAVNRAYMYIPDGERGVAVMAAVDGERLLCHKVAVSGHHEVPIRHAPDESGSALLTVAFGGLDHPDRRLYIYANEP